MPKRSITFVLYKPVKREIFAADFLDRIVYHFIINRLNPSFEKISIEDSYAFRIREGTHYGIVWLKRFVKEGSETYTIQGFYFNINKDIL